MRTKLVKRHYCDFCRKAGQVASLMAAHEKVCLRNPARACFLCAEDHAVPVPMAELIALFDEKGVDAVHEAVGGCPACILATILQQTTEDHVDFDYKAAKEEWYDEQQAITDF